jgi:hypothetical protein
MHPRKMALSQPRQNYYSLWLGNDDHREEEVGYDFSLICVQEKWLCHNLGRIIIPYAWAMMIIERRKRIMVIEYGHRESCYRKIFIIAWAMMYNYVSHLCGQH